MAKNIPFLSTSELAKLALVMAKLEQEHYLPFKLISGGYSSCGLVQWNTMYFFVEVSYGILNDVVNDMYTTRYTIDRNDLRVEEEFD
jgi:hypothetical protein